MFLPKGRPVYSGLKTTMVRIDRFLEDLKEEEFTGYMRIDFDDMLGVLFFERGHMVGATLEGEQQAGSDAASIILKRCMAGDRGVINVNALDPEMVSVLSSVSSAHPRVRDFPFDVIDVGKLLERLSREGFSGILEVKEEEKEASLLLFFFNGEPFDSVYEDVEVSLTGDDALEKIHELNQTPSAHMAIYETALEGEAAQAQAEAPSDVAGEAKRFFDAALPEILAEISITDIKRVAVELAEKYPFLDPFAPSVYVRDKELVIEEELPKEELIKGLTELLKGISKRLTKPTRRSAYSAASEAVSNRVVVEELFKALAED